MRGRTCRDCADDGAAAGGAAGAAGVCGAPVVTPGGALVVAPGVAPTVVVTPAGVVEAVAGSVVAVGTEEATFGAADRILILTRPICGPVKDRCPVFAS